MLSSTSPRTDGGGPFSKPFDVITPVLHVRSLPTLEPRALLIEQFHMGNRIMVDPNSRTEAEGYVWWHHADGWSSERKLDGSEIYLTSPDVINVPTAPNPTGTPAPSTVPPVPQPAFTFSQLPVGLDQMRWFYYYGNTQFAFTDGFKNGYQKYSQGLHGGIDFGHPGGIPVHAGVTGTFQYSGNQKAFPPNRVDIQVGKYLIIYGHVDSPINLPHGSVVQPNTVIGTVSPVMKHCHIEIRNGIFLYNPLYFLSDDLVQKLMAKFPPKGEFGFYSSPTWTKWQTPFDQPVIRLGGEYIGPPH